MDIQGIKIIGEMTREELIEEILAVHRERLEGAEDNDLKKLVVNLRIAQTHKRLIEEANLTPSAPDWLQGLFGYDG